jgi:hypothetical protein
MAPTGMPKMLSVPAASSDLIKLCAPVIDTPACSLITVSVLVSGLLWTGKKNPSAVDGEG